MKESGSDPTRVAETIDRILEAPKYRVPRPGVIDRWWQRFFNQLLEWIDSLLSGFPGGPSVFFWLLAAIVVGLSIFAAYRLGGRRNRQLESRAEVERLRAQGLNPDELERNAESAAGRGDFREAVRLRFVAGLLRLDQKKAIAYQPGLTGSEVGERIDNPEYDLLAASFDDIVYGDRTAGSDDDRDSSTRWRRVLEQVGDRVTGQR